MTFYPKYQNTGLIAYKAQWLIVRYRTISHLCYIGYSSGTGRLASEAICPVPDE